MDGFLSYREERLKGFDPIHDPIDLFFDVLGYIGDRLGTDNALQLLTCLLECL
jgi:hypothetical protein